MKNRQCFASRQTVVRAALEAAGLEPERVRELLRVTRFVGEHYARDGRSFCARFPLDLALDALKVDAGGFSDACDDLLAAGVFVHVHEGSTGSVKVVLRYDYLSIFSSRVYGRRRAS